ncbi:hypothetical protein SEA_CARTHAGE_100 [Mycobacterium phage Carthage]|nr:hypothetical protein SEA_CARTHAGE_100 [Mycobacterium phage Carthage]WKW85714.1 hypothetical protein SEA_BASATO_98 [Mycobacterium phage Basato]
MRWHRENHTGGAYAAGAYRVHRAEAAALGWVAKGPGVETSHHETKADAQAECERALNARIDDPNTEVVPGDHLLLRDSGKVGQLAQRLNGDETPADRVVYAIRMPYGKTLCRVRSEFTLIDPYDGVDKPTLVG